MRLAIVTTHPIQYNAPLFRLLAKQHGLDLKVFYTWSQTSAGSQYDPKFGRIIAWDIPLLEGYDYEFVENVSRRPGSGHFRGIDNPGLIQSIEAWQPSALLVYGWSFKSHLACLRYFKGRVPVLFRGDSTLIDETPGLKRRLRHLFLRWVYRYVDVALYVGEANKAYFLSCGLSGKQLVFAPHAVDNHRFEMNRESLEAEAKQRRSAIGLGEDDLVVMFAGKFESKKDPRFVLQLAKEIKRPGVKFLMVGNGALEDELKADASQENRVIFLDFQNQQAMPLVYRMANVFLLPSVRNETWGLAVNEAMACCRPVIVSSRVGCAPDLVRDGETGWSYEPGEGAVGQVAAILEQVCDGGISLKQMGIQASRHIQAYSYHAIIAAIMDIMNNISRIQEIRQKG